MSKWMCDVIGNQPSSEKKVEDIDKEGITHESLETFIAERGNLPTSVQNYIRGLGYEWSDSGGCAKNWHLGVPFDNLFEAMNYLDKMTEHFKTAIASGILSFRLSSWTLKHWKEVGDENIR